MPESASPTLKDDASILNFVSIANVAGRDEPGLKKVCGTRCLTRDVGDPLISGNKKYRQFSP